MKNFCYTSTLIIAIAFSSCKKDPCKGITCYNGGTCEDGKCKCTAAWTGTYCGTPADPCNGVVCYNSGYCSGGSCVCQAHFFGDSCRGQVAPDTMYIYRVVVNRYNPVDTTGTLWDISDGTLADIYPVITLNGGIAYKDIVLNKKDNVNHNSQWTFNLGADSLYIPSANITNPNYRLELWEYNAGGTDRYMRGFNFTPYPNDTTGFPGSRELIGDPLDPYESWYQFRIYYRYGWQ